MIELTVKRIPWPFPKRVHAVTLFPFIVYEPSARYDKAVQAHERYHWKDQMRWLVIPWFLVYIALLPFYGGYFEIFWTVRRVVQAYFSAGFWTGRIFTFAIAEGF